MENCCIYIMGFRSPSINNNFHGHNWKEGPDILWRDFQRWYTRSFCVASAIVSHYQNILLCLISLRTYPLLIYWLYVMKVTSSSLDIEEQNPYCLSHNSLFFIEISALNFFLKSITSLLINLMRLNGWFTMVIWTHLHS